MGISPLASMEIFATSAAVRRERERSLLSHLAASSNVSLANIYPNEFMRSMIENRRPHFELREAANLTTSLLKVAENSCYGRIRFFSVRGERPMESDWSSANDLCVKALDAGYCDSVMLVRGCSTKWFFGSRWSRAVIAVADVAKLAVLSNLDLLQYGRLEEVLGMLDFSGKPSRYCKKGWSKVVRECRDDPRFRNLLIEANGLTGSG
ncbi:hypothetical protein [Tahibacter harae]|uniref:Uncharacterized protein n=1 Tax=Tahibacter harae TaxID=2963937 RepID=A0ABT1QZQ1_9GAMM|nr:hypothetical protein [Tahibacter harae]MCQ4167728.1 hypothetical protein [Tahibacter harae]